MQSEKQIISLSGARLVAYAMRYLKKQAMPDDLPSHIQPSALFQKEMAASCAEGAMKSGEKQLCDSENKCKGGEESLFNRENNPQSGECRPLEEPEKRKSGEHKASFSHSAMGVHFEVTCASDAVTDCAAVYFAAVECDPASPPELLLRRLRGEGYCMLYAARRAGAFLSELRILFCNEESGQSHLYTESPTKTELDRFLGKLLPLLPSVAYPEVLRRARCESFRMLAFPLPEMREGQCDLIDAATTAFRSGRTLYASAPTGTGKTLAALYPAVRALGEGNGEKIFYFTPKTTGAIAAAETAELLHKAGADLRCVMIRAKAKICKTGADCRGEGHTCRHLFSSGERETEAALALLARGVTVVRPELLEEAAEAAHVCPYELALRYAEMCDLVICDYNYLFDLRVYFRRFFDTRGEYLFLLDEAHALVERAHEMYSAAWRLSDIEAILGKIKKECRLYLALKEIRTDFLRAFAPYLRDVTQKDSAGEITAFLSLAEFPERGYPVFAHLRDAVEKAMRDREDDPGIPRSELREIYYRISDFTLKLAYYSRKYRTFLAREGRDITVRIYCMDPSDLIEGRLAMGRAAFFFSGTLLPIDYYKTVLGGGNDAMTLVAESPFDRDAAAIAVLDKLSVRFHEREGGLSALLSVIEATVSSRVGNYMVFCPSYRYMESVASGFAERNPKIRTVVQERHMTEGARRRYLAAFDAGDGTPLVAFAVSGGIFAEGIDLAGDRLIGAVVVGVGLPTPSPERDAVAAYYDERFDAGREFAYLYPGMNRVLQAAGRVIRRETDRGVILLIDDRLADPTYKRILPNHWRGLRYVGDRESLSAYFRAFWKKQE